MTIIFFRKITPNAEKKIKESEAFIAIITKSFIKDEKCLEEARLAQKLDKPMYAIVKDEEAWSKIEPYFMWRMSMPFKEGVDEIIKKDLQIIRAVKDA